MEKSCYFVPVSRGIISIIVPELGLQSTVYLHGLPWLAGLPSPLLLQITVLINFAGKKHWAKQGWQQWLQTAWSCKV